MTDHWTTDFCIWRTICLVPVRCISSIRHMYTTDFAYDGPIFLVPLSLSYPSSPVLAVLGRNTSTSDVLSSQLVKTTTPHTQTLLSLPPLYRYRWGGGGTGKWQVNIDKNSATPKYSYIYSSRHPSLPVYRYWWGGIGGTAKSQVYRA